VSITEAEVQALLNRFLAPFAPYALSSRRHRGRARVMIKTLWTALIAGPDGEAKAWRLLTEKAHLAAEDLQTIKDCYYQKMKPRVSEEQLAALRERYRVKKNGDTK
jgi:hypothetical protein